MRHDEKPWGFFDQYSLNEASTVKILTVKAGARTSLQSHRHRKEFWVALDEGLTVQIEDKIMALNKGESITIERSVRHRLACKGPGEARVLEVSFGDFSENDIVRYEDDYGREKRQT